MPSPNDMLKESPEAVLAEKKSPPPPKGDKATAAYWSQATGIWPYYSALRAAGKTEDDMMTEAEFVKMTTDHGSRVVGSDGTILKGPGVKEVK